MIRATQTTRIDRARTHPARAISVFAAWSLSVFAHAQSDEGVMRILLDRSLEAQTIGLLEIAENGIVFVEETGLVRSVPFSDFAAIYLPDALIAPGPWVELTDGQRFAGAPAGGAEGSDDLFWDSPVFGSMRFSLDDVRRVVLDPQVDLETLSDGVNDGVVLRNGDVLSGFIERIGETITIDAGSGTVRIGIDRLAAAQLANETTDRQGVFVWLSDGTVANVASLATTHSMVEFARSPARLDTEANDVALKHTFPLGSLVALVPDSSTLRPLASLVLARQVGSAQRRWMPDAMIGSMHTRALDAADIEMPGPMRLEWDLPENSQLITLNATLSRRSSLWGDCEIIVHALVRGQDVPIARAHLSVEHPSESFIASFPEESTGLVITLDAGRFGPIQDEVTLRNAIVLIAR